MPTVSPRIEVFAIFDSSTGAPATGESPTFTVYKDDQGTNVSQPTIAEIGSTGLYWFTPNFPASAARSVAYIIDCGSGNSPRYYWKNLRQESYDEDKIKTIFQVNTGRWKIHTSGPYENQLVIYDADETTILYQFDLKDSSGSPTSTSPFEREPA